MTLTYLLATENSCVDYPSLYLSLLSCRMLQIDGKVIKCIQHAVKNWKKEKNDTLMTVEIRTQRKYWEFCLFLKKLNENRVSFTRRESRR